MLLFKSIFLLTGLAPTVFKCALASAVGSPRTKTTCHSIDVREEWRDLTPEHKAGYIDAVLCLMSLPPRENRKGVTSRFEEFQATHILLTDRVHTVGHFLPWHRHLGTLYGTALREECGYNGPIAFWDWSRDAEAKVPLVESPVFDSVLGFGGDGVPGTYKLPPDPNNESSTFLGIYRGCVQDGPFKDFKSHLGPGKLFTIHCIVRGIDEFWRESAKKKLTDKVIRESTSFEQLRLWVDDLMRTPVHGAGHGIVGGEMMNFYSAGADPLFYLHHANLDRIWWKWQELDPAKRLYDVSGPSTQTGNDSISLDFLMDFPALGADVRVGDVMDAASRSAGCFSYSY